MAGEYRYIAADLMSGTVLSELPISNAMFNKKLNSYGSFSGSVSMRPGTHVHPTGIEINSIVNERTVASTIPLRTALYVLRDSTVIWAGMVWARTYRQRTATLEVRGAEFWALLRNKRILSSTMTFNQVDQSDIVEALVSHAITKDYGNIGLGSNYPITNRLRDRTYFHYELHYIGELIENLAATIDGFDFSIESSYDRNSGDFSNVLHVWYPKKGRPSYLTDILFRLDQNIVDMEWPEDGFKAQNSVHGVGAGEAEAMIRSLRQDLVPLQAGYPLLEDVYSYKDIKDIATINEHLDERLVRSARQVVVPSVTVRADVEPIIGSYGLGDEARILVPPKREPFFWNGIDQSFRITEYQVTVDSLKGSEEVQLFFGDSVDPETAQIGLPQQVDQ